VVKIAEHGGDYKPTASIAEIARTLGHAKKTATGFKCSCPLHDDQNPSLTLSTSLRDGKLLFKCHKGCDQKQLVEEFKRRGWLNSAGPEPGRKREPARVMQAASRIVEAYRYTDEAGDLLYEVVRYEPKDFRQRRPDGRDGWIWSLGDCRRVLYHLPEVVDAARSGVLILIAEGEKDTDNLRDLGFCATTSPMGAGKWRREYAQSLRGAPVAILPDHDPQSVDKKTGAPLFHPDRFQAGTTLSTYWRASKALRIQYVLSNYRGSATRKIHQLDCAGRHGRRIARPDRECAARAATSMGRPKADCGRDERQRAGS
jgi:CHC2 zinc finger